MEKMKRRIYGAGILLVLAAVLICIGIARGELNVVLGKAVTVCLECIGLG